MIAYCFERKRIPPQNIAGQDSHNRFTAGFFGAFSEHSRVFLIENTKESLATFVYIIFQNINAIDGRHGKYGTPLILQLTFAVFLRNNL